MTRKIAFLVSDDLLADRAGDKRGDIFEFEEEFHALKPAFASMDMALEVVRWRDIAQAASQYAAALPLMVWDYFDNNQAEFMSAMRAASQNTLLLNPLNVLQWNSDKAYLNDLASQGVATIPTVAIEQVTQDHVDVAFEQFSAEKLVIKPQIGGGAWRQVLYERGTPFPPKDELPPEAALIQPFLASIKSEGEYSFLYFDGQFSHAAVKHAQKGDYRIQSIYGGTETPYVPSRDEIEQGQTILDALNFIPLYARVDLLRGTDGDLKLIELEMIEPYLYLPHAKIIDGLNQGALSLARALKARLEAV